MNLRLATVFFAAAAAAQDKVDFVTQVQPIFAKRCYDCHGPKEQEADLRFDRRDSVFPADQSKWLIVKPGKPAESELVKRIKLPADDADIMPADGEPLTKEQIALIERWIESGAEWPDAGTPAGEAAVPPPEQFAIALTAPQKQAVDAAVARLRERGAVAAPVARDLEALDVNLGLLRPKATDAEVELLAGVAPALVWLDLSRTAITDAGLAPLAKCRQLRRLHLAQTEVGDAALQHLAGLSELRFLNLFGTKVTDRGLTHLHRLPKLEKVFLWQTQVTDAGVAALREALPQVHVDRGGQADEILKVAEDLAAAAAKEKAQLGSIANSKCPVTGEAVDAGVTLVHEGRTVAFCCANCRAKFEADPIKFAPSLPPAKEGKKDDE